MGFLHLIFFLMEKQIRGFPRICSDISKSLTIRLIFGWYFSSDLAKLSSL